MIQVIKTKKRQFQLNIDQHLKKREIEMDQLIKRKKKKFFH
jgi:hypothetical protein